jgi:hypothetical protein
MAVGLLFSTNFSGSIHPSEDLRGPGRDDKPFFFITSLNYDTPRALGLSVRVGTSLDVGIGLLRRTGGIDEPFPLQSVPARSVI